MDDRSDSPALGRAETICALAGGLSHHLNNLLATALMSIDLLGDARSPAERELVAGLEESLRGAVALVRQMLWLARAGEGEPIAFQLRGLLGDAQRMLRALLPEAVEVTTDYPPELPLLHGDPVPVYRLLVHLGLAAAESLTATGGAIALAVRAAPPGVVVEASAGGGEVRPRPELAELARQAGGLLEAAPGLLRARLPADDRR